MTTPTVAILEKRLLHWWQRATPVQRAEGMRWYRNARKEIRELAHKHGYPHTLVAAAAAVLSPGITWKQNLLAIDALLSGKPCRTFHRNCKQAEAILRGDAQLTGNKRIAFAAALAGDDNAVVIDRWMLRAVQLPDSSGAATGRYVRIATALHNAASAVGIRPAALQAAIWLAIRTEAGHSNPIGQGAA